MRSLEAILSQLRIKMDFEPENQIGAKFEEDLDKMMSKCDIDDVEMIQWRCLVPTTSSQGPSVALHAKPRYDSSHSGTTIDAQGCLDIAQVAGLSPSSLLLLHFWRVWETLQVLTFMYLFYLKKLKNWRKFNRVSIELRIEMQKFGELYKHCELLLLPILTPSSLWRFRILELRLLQLTK
ncbi:hypothetical protein H5410_001137 [Solanum commersonii]|uniref:Uncharacterized protein n=1 Tax=Solanum commersonii TaxID=4109 RepID=A0A9J6AY97_SOLCO|nr:hypothetical protein H5410_001137 [Solanum commersonii]